MCITVVQQVYNTTCVHETHLLVSSDECLQFAASSLEGRSQEVVMEAGGGGEEESVWFERLEPQRYVVGVSLHHRAEGDLYDVAAVERNVLGHCKQRIYQSLSTSVIKAYVN